MSGLKLFFTAYVLCFWCPVVALSFNWWPMSLTCSLPYTALCAISAGIVWRLK